MLGRLGSSVAFLERGMGTCDDEGLLSVDARPHDARLTSHQSSSDSQDRPGARQYKTLLQCLVVRHTHGLMKCCLSFILCQLSFRMSLLASSWFRRCGAFKDVQQRKAQRRQSSKCQPPRGKAERCGIISTGA